MVGSLGGYTVERAGVHTQPDSFLVRLEIPDLSSLSVIVASI